jgi:hypothetical protein
VFNFSLRLLCPLERPHLTIKWEIEFRRRSIGFWKKEKSLLSAGNWTSIPRFSMSKICQYTGHAIEACSSEWVPQNEEVKSGVRHTSSFSRLIYVSCRLHVLACLTEKVFLTLKGQEVVDWSWRLGIKIPCGAVNLTPAFELLATIMTDIFFFWRYNPLWVCIL